MFYITTLPFGHPFLKRRGIFATALVVRNTELISNRKFDKHSQQSVYQNILSDFRKISHQ